MNLNLNLTSALIPHSEFHKGSWFISIENPVWYYFLRTENKNHISNKDFMNSVDEPLKRLVGFLHKQGIRTTPSCSGHYRKVEEYEKIHEQLLKDQITIREDGLFFRDIESGKINCFQNKNYQLPWHKEDFLKQIMEYQHKGVLGMRLENQKKSTQDILNYRMPGVSVKQVDEIVLIEINQPNQQENLAAWKNITCAIEDILQRKGIVFNN